MLKIKLRRSFGKNKKKKVTEKNLRLEKQSGGLKGILQMKINIQTIVRWAKNRKILDR